ncbi:MAG TPA: HEAT repeat domain-containing protein [Armatimonadetes bacterium]|nr:HEAT repeat domain-containing protein [Armatimonadota bacterium]
MPLMRKLSERIAAKLRRSGNPELIRFAEEVEGFPPEGFWDRFFEEAKGKLGLEALRQVQLLLAQDEDAGVRYQVMRRIGETSVLVELARKASVQVKCELLDIMLDREREKFMAVAREMIKDPDPMVKKEVIHKIGDDASLVELAKDPDPVVRQAVALMTSNEHILETLSQDPEPMVRRAVAMRTKSEEVLRRLAWDDDLTVKSAARERMQKLGYSEPKESLLRRLFKFGRKRG